MTSPVQTLRNTRGKRPGPARVPRRPHGLSARKGRAAQAAQAEQRRLARAEGKTCLCHDAHSGPANGVRQLEKRRGVQTVRWNRLRQTGHDEIAPAGDIWHRRLAIVEGEGGACRADVFIYGAPPAATPFIDPDLDRRWRALHTPLTAADLKRHLDDWLDGWAS